jgi:tRNA-binding EMAP/Myf-like protein
MKDTHEVRVVRIEAVTPHPNADKLELTMLGGYQMVIGKGAFKPGDLAVFIQPDSVVPQTEPFKFIWKDAVGLVGTVPESRRRIKPKRLRGEWSEGLLMPLSDFALIEDSFAYPGVAEGDNIASVIGVTHWVPEFDREDTGGNVVHMPKKKYPKTLRGWFWWTLYKVFGVGQRNWALAVSFDTPIYDVKALKNYGHHIQYGDLVHVTEKIHGSNARYTVVNGVFYCGSHEQWKQQGPNVWWNVARKYPQIEEWCRRYPGWVLYGEVGPTRKGFRYGCGDGEVFFYAFDIYNPEANEWDWPGQLGFAQTVPAIYYGKFDTAAVKALVDGPSKVVNAGHMREGIVIRKVDPVTRQSICSLKWVSNEFLTKDGK